MSPPAEAHLQMIQSVISRLASQSTTVKGWSITLTAALLGYATTTGTALLAFVAAYVILAFAALDTYYLTLERAYRHLYSQAINGGASAWTLTVNPPTLRTYLSAMVNPAGLILYASSLVIVASLGAYLEIH